MIHTTCLISIIIQFNKLEKVRIETDSDDSSYVDNESVLLKQVQDSIPKGREDNDGLMNVYNQDKEAIVLRRCDLHNRYARLFCNHTNGTELCSNAICDMCLYSRGVFVTKYPVLKPMSHLLCSAHFKVELRKVQDGKFDELLDVELEEMMECDPTMLSDDICPYCTNKVKDDDHQPKVFHLLNFIAYLHIFLIIYVYLLIFIIFFGYLHNFFVTGKIQAI